VWSQLEGRGVESPEALIELTVRSAWEAGRRYWPELAAGWVLEMAHESTFDRRFISEMSLKVADSDIFQVKCEKG
jgi:hypothetical protein